MGAQRKGRQLRRACPEEEKLKVNLVRESEEPEGYARQQTGTSSGKPKVKGSFKHL